MQVFMLPADAILNIDTLSELLASGHSRVPVHVPGNRYAALGAIDSFKRMLDRLSRPS